MRRLPMSVLMFTVALAGLLSWYGARASAQAGALPGEVVAAGNFIHVVSDAERSLAFYRDVMGMDVQQPAGGQAPPPGPRPFIATPQIVRLYNGGQAQYRTATAMIAESPMRAELIEFKDVPRAPVAPRIQDPGASFLILTVRDLDAVLARVKTTGTSIVTAGGQPVTLARDGVKMRALLVRDPDGFFVQIIQRDPAPQTAAPPDRNVIDVGFGFTVSSTERMMTVFTEAFGFAPRTGPPTSVEADLALTGTPGAEYTRTTATVPGSSVQVEFLEFAKVDRTPVRSTTVDPGTPVLRLRVRDTNDMVQRLAAVGVKVWSTGGVPVDVINAANAQRFAMTSAPDNLYVQIVQTLPRAQ